MVDKICKCDHLEKDHTYMDKSPQELLIHFVMVGSFVPQHRSDGSQAEGYRLPNGSFLFHCDALAEIEHMRQSYSFCKRKRFFMGCKCKAFEADNLKTLENAYEHKTR